MSNQLRALILGDVIGQSGCRALFINLQKLKKKYLADVVIVNGENAAEGYGITPEIADQIFSQGADVITSGNHIWQKREILDYMDKNPNLIRPANYPGNPQGNGYATIQVRNKQVSVLNLQGRESMGNTDCPFRKGSDILRKNLKDSDVVIIDFHAESSMEKESLAYYLDGKVSLVFGTHTHIQTADERILPGGTGYITDIGSTGVMDSVIGFDPAIAIQRSLSQMPLRQEVLNQEADIQGILVTIDPDSGKTLEIIRIQESSEL